MDLALRPDNREILSKPVHGEPSGCGGSEAVSELRLGDGLLPQLRFFDASLLTSHLEPPTPTKSLPPPTLISRSRDGVGLVLRWWSFRFPDAMGCRASFGRRLGGLAFGGYAWSSGVIGLLRVIGCLRGFPIR